MGYPRTFDDWMAWCGHFHGYDKDATRFEFESVLSRVIRGYGRLNASREDVIALSCAVWQEPPTALGDWGALRPFQALALASAAYQAEIVPPADAPVDTVTAARWVRALVTAVEWDRPGTFYYRQKQRAALAAVRQLGGWTKVGIPAWVQTALGDDRPMSEEVLQAVEQACACTSPGRHWRYVSGLGFITYGKPDGPARHGGLEA
ncbi:hypothetical protein [Nocardia sp. NRRL S-836]|uniref:hypothetical protein n=1 Tax=Nocardia sp. NRRL S-836 TaxID=1519492 RepID=UPI0006B04F4B|nr:hypothetical protein [Nocardia sp. NRRL S-836]KOV84788.1 hypothetical protein ADL03_16115 [Nocardia sp. NRRL S-836]